MRAPASRAPPARGRPCGSRRRRGAIDAPLVHGLGGSEELAHLLVRPRRGRARDEAGLDEMRRPALVHPPWRSGSAPRVDRRHPRGPGGCGSGRCVRARSTSSRASRAPRRRARRTFPGLFRPASVRQHPGDTRRCSAPPPMKVSIAVMPSATGNTTGGRSCIEPVSQGCVGGGGYGRLAEGRRTHGDGQRGRARGHRGG